MDVILVAIALGALKAALTMLIKKRAAIKKFVTEGLAKKEAHEALIEQSAAITSLCANCTSAHIVTGYRESEIMVICTEATPQITVRFEVKECTKYVARDRPTPVPRKLGFFVEELEADEDEPKLVGVDK
jgi:hypothetical protein